MNETLLRKERFRPSIAVPIKVTVRIPITMPSVVSTERSLLARMALQEMSRPSFSSVRNFMSPSEAPSSNIQHPVKEALTSNMQHPEKIQAPNSNSRARHLELGCWSLDVGFLSHQNAPFLLRAQLHRLVARN